MSTITTPHVNGKVAAKVAPKLRINPKFKNLIPDLHPDELAGLEASIIAEGCRDALVVWNGILIDGHNRYQICTAHGIDYQVVEMSFKDDDAASVWIIRNQFGRRNLAPFTRAELALKLEPLLRQQAKDRQRESGGPVPQKSAKPPLETRKELAKVAGLSHDTIDKVKTILDHADEQTKDRLRRNEISIHRVAKGIKQTTQRDERRAERMDAIKGLVVPDDDRIIVGDFREHAAKIPDGSLSLIFTDPPYIGDCSDVLMALAEFAAAKLADGGSLISYIGHTKLPQAMAAFQKHLRYYWIVACVHANGAPEMREYGIKATWTPVLWFVKGSREIKGWVLDSMSGGKEKDGHDWQKSQTEAEYWIDKLCPVDGIVCDPFLGSGTTAAAAERLGRKWIGMEIDEATATIARARIARTMVDAAAPCVLAAG